MEATFLTWQDRRILELRAEGLRYDEIGRKLGIAERTVKAHMARMSKRTGLRPLQLAKYWNCELFQRGLAA